MKPLKEVRNSGKRNNRKKSGNKVDMDSKERDCQREGSGHFCKI